MYDWKEEYCIGVEKIDNQHRQLFKIVARIENIMADGDKERNKAAVAEQIKYLVNYTVEHFNDEELYQKSIGYSDFLNHHAAHEAFKEEVLEYEKKLEEDNFNSEDVNNFVNMVKEWLLNHIIRVDQKIKNSN